MKVLLHICCGPCAIYPVNSLREKGFQVEGFFYNPNIHPYSEYLKRKEAALEVSKRLSLKMDLHKYDLESFIKSVALVEDPSLRHGICWRLRLEETARRAAEQGIRSFTTTLLGSPYQDVAEIGRIGREIAEARNLGFHEENFRRGFAQAHKQSREWNIYHQNYCGCLYSEKEAVDARKRKEESKIIGIEHRA